ncbi:hypothetical protein BASA81_008810 [Batrachochytrium salamandrivorans]|nr:hypothetical protein BASA81_008810 [Batrachochytrium salamandrivorans]
MKRLAQELRSARGLGELEASVLSAPANLLDPANCSAAVSQLAKWQSSNPLAIEHVMRAAKPLNFPARELSNFCHGIARGRLLPRLPDFVLEQIPKLQFASFDFSQTLWSTAKLNQPVKSLEDKLWEVDWLAAKPRDIANTMWALASFNNQIQGKRFAIEVILTRGVADFNAFDLSNISWSMVKLDQGELQLQQLVVNRALELEWTASQDLANMLWALATWRYDSPDELLNKLDREVKSFDSFKPQELATSAWALALLLTRQTNTAITTTRTGLMRKIALAVVARKDIVKQKDLTELLWAFATVNICGNPGGVLDVIARRIHGPLLPQETATIAWSMAVLGFVDDRLMATLALNISKKIDGFNSQDISNSMWAFAKLEWYSIQVASAVADEVKKRTAQQFTSRSLVNILWAFAHLRVTNDKLCQRITTALSQLPNSELSLQDQASIMSSLAILGFKTNSLFSRIAKVVTEESDPEQVLVLMWSFACCNALKLAEVKQLFQLDLTKAGLLKHNSRSAIQLHQIQLAWNLAHAGEISVLIDTMSQGNWVDAAKSLVEISSSKTHERVTAQLRVEFPSEEVVMETFANGISVDILLPRLGMVIEVDGPQHFFNNAPHTKTGTTLFKLRLLKAAGYQVYSVPVLHELDHPKHTQRVQQLINALLKQNQRVS